MRGLKTGRIKKSAKGGHRVGPRGGQYVLGMSGKKHYVGKTRVPFGPAWSKSPRFPKSGTRTTIGVYRGTGARRKLTASIPGYWFNGRKVTIPR